MAKSKEQITAQMIKKANDMLKNGWSRDVENELWRTASENDIFMSEYYDDNGDLKGFYIEDDYWTFEF